MENKTVFLVGGGTGGHIVPIFRMYKELSRRKNLRVFIIGAGSSIEQDFFASCPDYVPIRSGKMHRSITINNITEFINFFIGIFQSIFLIKKNHPDLIFLKGGYVSWPFTFWAKLLKIPYFIHESDAVMGAANRFAAGGASKIFTGFPTSSYLHVDKKKTEFVGQLIKIDINQKEDKYSFGFKGDQPIIFVTGGSQGSRKINRVIFASLPRLLEKYSVIHQTGALDYNEAIKIRSNLSEQARQSYFIRDFLDRIGGFDLMANALKKADLVIARAGATTIAEIAGLKKPMILIPYRYAAADHQKQNALMMEKKKAAVVILEDGLTADFLFSYVEKLFSTPEKLKELGENAYKVFPLNGVEKISHEIIHFLRENNGK